MARFEAGTIIELDAREVVTLPDVRSAMLRVTRGTLWITQEGDPQDVVLRAGDSWEVERNGLMVVEAQNDTSFWVMGRRIETSIAGRQGVVSRVWSWTRDVIAAFFATPARSAPPNV